MKKLIALLGAAFLFAACGDDENGGVTPDAPVGGPDAAADLVFDVTLTTAAEVPVCAGAGASATGSGTVTLSADESTITVSLTHSGLSGDATAGHLHCGDATQSGGVAIGFTSAASPISQTLTASDFTPGGMNCPANFAAFVADLKDGKAYVNIHTMACMAGEIRGQIE